MFNIKKLRWLIFFLFLTAVVLLASRIFRDEDMEPKKSREPSNVAQPQADLQKNSIESRVQKHDSNSANQRNLLDLYLAGAWGRGQASSDSIEEIRSLGGRLSTANLLEIGILIKDGKVGGAEMASLIRLYGEQVPLSENPTEMRAILRIALANAKDKSVGAAAAFSLSRVGDSLEVSEVLKTARTNNYFTDRDYFGELAHNILRVTPETQKEWLNELRASQNLYARQIVVDVLMRSEVAASFAEAQRLQLLGYLESSEPEFPSNLQEMGLFTAIDYQNWIKAVSKMGPATSEAQQQAFIISKLLAEGVDQRKVLSYLLNEENLSKFVGSTSNVQRLYTADKLATFVGKYPNDFYIEVLKHIHPKLSKGG
jgi:hypothetical protein